MTNGRLQELLKQFPDDLEILVSSELTVEGNNAHGPVQKLTDLKEILDVDTNKDVVVLIGKQLT